MTHPSAEASSTTDDGQNVDVYRHRAKIGRIALAVRTAIAQVVILGGTVVLARYLRPADYGAFAMVQAVLTVLTLVGDGGLGGALIQKKSSPTQEELSSVFFAQLSLAVVVMLLAFGLGMILPTFWPDLPAHVSWILLALGANFMFVCARVVPTLLMERELHFVRVSILDTVNSITFFLVASVLALKGFGVWALVLGVLAQGSIGFLVAVLLRPWRPSFVFKPAVVRGLLGFGVPYQARTALTLLTRSSIPVIAGTMMGTHSVGLLNWALETAFFPLTFIEIIARVSFPLYSRLQGEPALFSAEMERSMRLGATITLLMSGLFLGLGPELTVIVYGAQWQEAVPALGAFAAGVTLGMLVFVLAPAFDAIGKPRIVMLQMLFVACAVWLATWLGMRVNGIAGFAIGYSVVLATGAIGIWLVARKALPTFPIIRPFLAPAIGSIAIILIGRLALGPVTRGPLMLIVSVLAEVIVFLVIVAALDKKTRDVLHASLPGQKPAVLGAS